MRQPPRRITPLWIIAAFVTMTETTLGYAVTKTDGGIQIALTVFVISFAVTVATAFFVVLWHRPFVFYSPSEYGDIDPAAFIGAIKSSVSPELAEHVREVERNPGSQDAQFALIDGLMDEVHRQHLILMAEKDVSIPYQDTHSHPYTVGTRNQYCSSGLFDPQLFVAKLETTQFLEVTHRSPPTIRITAKGRAFAQWLLDNGRKAGFIDTPLGKWGEPFTFREDRKVRPPDRGKQTDREPPSNSPVP